MKNTWLNFLKNLHVSPINLMTSVLMPVPQLTVLKVTGQDANVFLQGQLTCNIQKLNSDNSFFSAFCNPKGRVISTLIIFKQNNDFLIILPTVLREEIQKKLQRYILRSDVDIQDVGEEFCLSGLSKFSQESPALPLENFTRQNEFIKLPQSRYLLVTSVEKSIDFYSVTLKGDVILQSACLWDYLDISSGLAWLDKSSSEAYIPQMLNVGLWGGINFDKGCYTGQEIIARTHYLGQSKRKLVIGECATDIRFKNGDIHNSAGDIIAKVIKSQVSNQKQYLLMVIKASELGGEKTRFNVPIKIIIPK